jgi:hypothetical protein
LTAAGAGVEGEEERSNGHCPLPRLTKNKKRKKGNIRNTKTTNENLFKKKQIIRLNTQDDQ